MASLGKLLSPDEYYLIRLCVKLMDLSVLADTTAKNTEVKPEGITVHVSSAAAAR